MTTTFTETEISLKNLVMHPRNVRSQSEASYTDEAVSKLAANIDACGLLQPLLVQKLEDNSYGVLAGGRRLAALKLMAAQKDVKAFKLSTKVSCRVVPVGVETTSILSFSENELQLPMDAIDRYEAFSAMLQDDGAGVADIARSFGITERTVKEAMRLGNIHPDIRKAHREGKLGLEALKAFDAHPDPKVQLEAYTGLIEAHGTIQHWHVRTVFQNKWVRVGDALGAFVLDEYREAGGEIVADLIEEDSILSDDVLIQKVLSDKLDDLAEERRNALGFAWAAHAVEPDWNAFDDYGRVYPNLVELDDAAEAKITTLSASIENIEARLIDADTSEEEERLESEYNGIMEQIDALKYAYNADDMQNSGVIAMWQHGEVSYNLGMVRPEDKPSKKSAAAGQGADLDGSEAPQGPKLSEKLRIDMAHVRTRAIGLALASSPNVARDYADYSLLRQVLDGSYYGYSGTTTLSASVASRGPGDVEGSLALIEESFEALHNDLDLKWLEAGSDSEAFMQFRGLSEEMRAQLLAFAVAHTLKPTNAKDYADGARTLVEQEVLPNLREVWTPDEGFLKRLTKPDLLNILGEELFMADEAKAMAGSKKSAIVTYLVNLFAQPFATLTDAQRAAVASWCPEFLQTQALEGDAEDVAADDSVAIAA